MRAFDELTKTGRVGRLRLLATDTLRTDKGTEFVRTNGVASITVPTTGPSGSGPAMKFIYGRVGNRWGWIAYDALRPK